MNRLAPIFIVLAGFGLAYLLIITGPKLDPQPKPQLPPLVRTIAAIPIEVNLSTYTHGTVAPRTESELVPEISGRIIEISQAMVSGGFFKKGDLLIKVDSLDYEVALQRAKSGLTRSASDLDNAHKAHQRQLNLAQKQSTSDSQRDDAFNRLQIAEATFDEAKANLSRAAKDLERTSIVAPYDGRIRSEKVDVGQFINRGSPIATIYATDSVEIRLPIHDEELAYLDLSLRENKRLLAKPIPVTLRARFAGADHQWAGTIVRTEGELDPQTHMVNIVASVQSPYDENVHETPLSVGLFVEAEIHGSTRANIIVLPRSALRENNQVYAIDEQSTLRIKDIKIFRIANDKVFVSSGIEKNELVSISAMNNAIEGMTVRLATSGGKS